LQLALDAARARAGAERLAGLDGVLGTLLDVIAIDAGWEAAVEAALGEALSAVVVESASNARSALEALRTSATSGAVLAAVSAHATKAEVPSGCASVLGHVRATNSGVQSLLERLLSHAVSAPTLDAAIDTALAHQDLVVVTQDGDRLSSTGWRIGSSSGGATAAALEEVSARVAAATQARDAAEQGRLEARTALDAALAAERELVTALDRNDGRFIAASEALSQAQARRREVDAEREGAARSITELVTVIEGDEQRLAELEAALPSLVAEEQAEADAVRQRDESRAGS
jgi:chromosome segregation protein